VRALEGVSVRGDDRSWRPGGESVDASIADGGGVCEPEKIGTGGSKQSGELIYYGVAS
jgi:hypothetical protein